MPSASEQNITSHVVASAVRGQNQGGIRAHNERLVLSILRRNGPMAKADIARATGLSAQTISVIMRGLEQDGLLERGDPIRGRVGQPSVPMHLTRSGAYFFGFKVGRRSADLVLMDFLGTILGRVHRTHPYPTPDDMVQFAQKAMAELRGNLPVAERERIAGLGIAIPFRLWDWARSIGAPTEVMDTWRTRDIQAEIAKTASCPVYLQNDASAACGAELVFGKADVAGDFLHFYVGYFIGGGLVLGNRLHTGPTGNACAIGPLPIPGVHGKTQPLIEVASLCVLEHALEAKGQNARSLWEPPEAWDVDDEVLGEWITEAGNGLAFASASASAVLDLAAVLIDGWMPADVRQRLVAAIDASLKRFDLTGIQPPAVLEGSIGPDARSLGAASLPLSERFLVDVDAMPRAG